MVEITELAVYDGTVIHWEEKKEDGNMSSSCWILHNIFDFLHYMNGSMNLFMFYI